MTDDKPLAAMADEELLATVAHLSAQYSKCGLDMPDPDNILELGGSTITISHRKEKYEFSFPAFSTVTDLMDEIEASLNIPVNNQKIIVPKGPLLKAPLKDPFMAVSDFQGKTLMLVGSGAAAVQAVENMCDKLAKRNAARMAKVPLRRRLPSPEATKYTFLQVRPLAGLPHPERSQMLLMRLKMDPGIRAAMKKHKLTVALLTEMEPLSNTQTTHEGTSRLLGLNRNQGEVIELRLRTDAHDGYRDYKTIRKTLCHELTHNIHGPHDGQFWELCHEIERLVERADWKSSGHTIGETSRYTVSGQEECDRMDEGGWTGGEFVLGGVREQSPGLSRREILAQAALERQRQETEAEGKAAEASVTGWRPRQRPQTKDAEH